MSSLISPTTYLERLNIMYLSSDTVSLTEADLNCAVELAKHAPTEPQQWQTYLNVMARLGVETWLHQRAPELQMNHFHFHSPTQSVDAVCQLQVGKFRLYLLATDDLNAIEIPISEAIIASSFTPHLCVLVEVLDELGQIQVHSAIQRAQLIQQVRSLPLEAGNYWLNIDTFDATPDRLLLWLRCLDANAMPTAAYAKPQTTPAQNEIQQSVINLGLWLNDRLDQVAQEFAWILLPPPVPSFAFRPLRSPIEEFNHVLGELTQQGRINAPPQARGGYRDFQWEDASLRLYALTWKISDEDWSLLFVLGAQPGTTLPIGARLQVRDEHQILAEPVLRDRTQDYLFAQVIGTGTENFWASISFNSGAVLTLPPFTLITC